MSDPATTSSVPASTRSERVGWYFYDWANSAFFTTVVTTLFGPHLTEVTRAAADANGFVHPFGFAVNYKAYWPFVSALSVVLQVIFLPILGAIADYSQKKKLMLGICAYLGAFATMCLYYLDGTRFLYGGICFIIANVSFGASVIFYNAFLPDIAAPSERDAVSSTGWAVGYLGGGLLLAINFLTFLNLGPLGLTTTQAIKISLFAAGAWAAVFTLLPLLLLRSRGEAQSLPPGANYLTVGFKQLGHTLRSLRQYPHTLLFLAACLIYNDGIHTVITMSGTFGEKEVGLKTDQLIKSILIVQFVAFAGALLFGRVARIMGAKKAIVLSLIVWSGSVVYAYAFLKTVPQFFIMAAVMALVLGGSQALTRSLFSLMIPKGKEAEYFSIYEISQHGTSWLGPLCFGFALQYLNSYRIAILSIIFFFIVGLILLLMVDVRRAIREAGNEPPLII